MNLNQFNNFESELVIEKTSPNEEPNCFTSPVYSDIQSNVNMLLSPTYINQFIHCDSSIVDEPAKTDACMDHLIEGPVNPNTDIAN